MALATVPFQAGYHPGNGNREVLIVGAGPAGLTAAWELEKAGKKSFVFEKDPGVGGISRTVNFKGFRFDIGGHRFFTKVPRIDHMWKEILGEDLLQRPRQSRIYFGGKYFDYPLRAANAVAGLGLRHSTSAVLSYMTAKTHPRTPERSVEDWIINRFGRVLYEAFFKTYTEKVWGISCAEIEPGWAEQRIRGLSLRRAVMAALPFGYGKNIKTLTTEFYYPKLGAGQMWEAVQSRLNPANRVLTEAEVVSLKHQDGFITELVVKSKGECVTYPAGEVISSMPLRELIERMDPAPPLPVLNAARGLRYRDFLIVTLLIDKPNLFTDNWIYIHDPHVQVGRIQNFGNWSPDMVPNPGYSCLGMEYFCFEGDEIWSMNDRDLLTLAAKEVFELGLAPAICEPNGTVVRIRKAYPVYDSACGSKIAVIRKYLDSFCNLHPVGRNGLHKYNNQDHSMFTAMLAVHNVLGGKHDIWAVNTDCEYHEEIKEPMFTQALQAGS